MRPAEEAKILLKAAAHRVELPLAAEVPLADHAGGVASLFEALSERRFREWQADVLAFRRRAGVELMAEPLLIAACHQAGPRRAAIRPRDVTVGAADAVLCDRVDVGRGNVLAALDADIAIAHVIANDDEDIGFGVGILCGEC